MCNSSKTFFVSFVCLEFFVPLENFSLVRRRYHDQYSAANFELCPVLMAIEQWGFFSVPHLLWQGASVHNGHLRGPVTLTPIADCLAVELSLPVYTRTTEVCRGWDSNTQPSAFGAIALTHCASPPRSLQFSSKTLHSLSLINRHWTPSIMTVVPV